MLDTFEGMHEELRALRGAEPGTLTLAASTTPGSYVLPSLLECFAERHPRVEVDVVIGSSRWVSERVAHREASLGMAGELDWPDGVIAGPFLEDEIVGIAAPGRLPARATLDLIARETLLSREPGSSTRVVAERFLAPLAYRPAKRWELDSDGGIKRTVRPAWASASSRAARRCARAVPRASPVARSLERELFALGNRRIAHLH